jgi:glycosyltransferase involved in cell wall biosynthesis
MPTVSVIVPNYNHARFLRQRLDTILAQTYQDFELILLDDCSTDNSVSILREYVSNEHVSHFEVNEANSGSTFKQWNKSVRIARGKYVWIAESDDYADHRFLERLVALLEADREITFAYCSSRHVSSDGGLQGPADWYLDFWNPLQWRSDFCLDGREMCEKYFCGINPVPNASAVLFRKDSFERVGCADERLQLCGDWKLWASIALEGKVAYSCECLNYYRLHEGSVRTRSELNHAVVSEDLQLCLWVLGRVTVSHARLEKIRQLKAGLWVPALMSLRIPISRKREILRQVRALDPRPIRRVIRPIFATVLLKFNRHCRNLGRHTCTSGQ